MPEQPFFPTVPCTICAERPGTLHMVVQTDAGLQGALLCESCARELMEGFGQAGIGPAATDASTGVPMDQPVFGSGPLTQARARSDRRQDASKTSVSVWCLRMVVGVRSGLLGSGRAAG
jgi:ATP-dependent Clp protease ATP-binding subunit ClpC